MTFEECRSTCLRPQALLTLVVGLAACGQERVTDPFTPVFREAADTVGVLRAVASAIVEMNARWDTARVAPDFPANCRQRGLVCWSIETTGWYVSTGDHATTMLADLLGVRVATRSPAPPACPWPSPAPAGGYWAAVRIRFTGPDLAEVALSRRCDSSRGDRHRAFGSWETFEVRRVDRGWQAEIASVGVT